jgi:hypothetical protein
MFANASQFNGADSWVAEDGKTIKKELDRVLKKNGFAEEGEKPKSPPKPKKKKIVAEEEVTTEAEAKPKSPPKKKKLRIKLKAQARRTENHQSRLTRRGRKSSKINNSYVSLLEYFRQILYLFLRTIFT